MDGRTSDNLRLCAYCPGRIGRNNADCICCPVGGALVFSDHHSGVGDMAPSPTLEAARQLQVMAKLIAPFAGEAAPEIAGQLRREFGSLSSAMRAPAWRLREATSNFPKECELLIAARRLIDAARNEKLRGTPVIPDDRALLEYLRKRLGRSLEERLLVVFCDRGNGFIMDEEMGWGTPDTVRIDVANLIRKALAVGAKMILLAHNHPSGHCAPSGQDIRATTHLSRVTRSYGLGIIDHLVVTPDRVFSMRGGGLL